MVCDFFWEEKKVKKIGRSNMISKTISWTKERSKERTSWDGAALIAAGIIMIIMPMALIAYAAIAWGAWTIWKAE